MLERDDYNLVTFPVAHGVQALGFALRRAPAARAASTSSAADALGVPSGPERGLLQAGEIDARSRTAAWSRRTRCSATPRPGRKVVLSGDTAPSATVLEAARGAEVLVHEATFLEEERERARETAHSTALEAAEIAREAEVGLLALTHLSNRYFGPEVAREARTIFPETVVPKDFDVIDVPFPERGSPSSSRAARVTAARQSRPGARRRRRVP